MTVNKNFDDIFIIGSESVSMASGGFELCKSIRNNDQFGICCGLIGTWFHLSKLNKKDKITFDKEIRYEKHQKNTQKIVLYRTIGSRAMLLSVVSGMSQCLFIIF